MVLEHAREGGKRGLGDSRLRRWSRPCRRDNWMQVHSGLTNCEWIFDRHASHASSADEATTSNPSNISSRTRQVWSNISPAATRLRGISRNVSYRQTRHLYLLMSDSGSPSSKTSILKSRASGEHDGIENSTVLRRVHTIISSVTGTLAMPGVAVFRHCLCCLSLCLAASLFLRGITCRPTGNAIRARC